VRSFLAISLPVLFVAACSSTSHASMPIYERHALVDIEYPPPVITSRGTEIGVSSWYGPGFHGQSTASGEQYDQFAMTAAHRTLPLGTWVEVHNMTNRRMVRVRINDRGPYKLGRILDLSYAAAHGLDMLGPGTANVEIRILDRRYRQWPMVRYSVQIGAFRDRSEANSAAGVVATAGERAYLKTTASTEFPWSVRVGPFTRRRDALAARDRLRANGFQALLVEEDPPAYVYAGDATAVARSAP
jgi:rare lipoprotein A